MDEAINCDSIGMMSRGKIIIKGKPENIIRDAGAENLEDAFLKLTSGTVGEEGTI
jgi:ABC-2 type transport system ATP-binding protein